MRGTVVYEVLGPFDFIVDLQADTSEELTSALRGDIRSIPGVSATLTCTVIEGEDK
jgi:DNA-binding Lrp family transcriptional regulator